MEEVGGLMVDRLLQFTLCRRVGGKITDSTGSDVVLGKRINKPFANFGCFC